jgi:predicted DNA-binding transcriptional regulator YafY
VPAPASRLLELLELLQGRPLTTGREIADRLGVDRRTVRRYVARLQELGIPIEGERGVGGGYRVRPGFRLPPLMLDDEEAIMVVLGLVAAKRLGLDGASGHADGALTKLHRVLPETLRGRVEALEQTLGFTAPVTEGEPAAGATVLLLADAIRRGRRIGARYRTFEGEEAERDLSPYGLVVHSGRWYLAAFDHTRDALRTFRVDRMSRAAIGGGAALAPPDGFDAVVHVSRSLARAPWPWEVEVLLDLALDDAERRVPAGLAELTGADDGTLMRLRVISLDWTASLLAGLGCSFTIRSPDELRASLRALAGRLTDAAEKPVG